MTGTRAPVAVEVLLAGMGAVDPCAELQCPPLPWLLLLEYRVVLLPGHLNFPHHGLCTAFWRILPHPCAACLAACTIQLCPVWEERKIWASWTSLLVPLGSPVLGSSDRTALPAQRCRGPALRAN